MENIRFFGGVYGLRGKHLKDRSEWVLQTAQLEGKASRITGTLPGGFKQRLALGCALIHEPTIVFLDEPTGGVDPISRRHFWELIQNLAEQGITILVTTHFLDEAEYCHSIALINAGELVAYGTPQSLKTAYVPYPIIELETNKPLEAFSLLQNQSEFTEISLFGLTLHIGVQNPVSGTPRIRDLLLEHDLKIVNLNQIIPSLEDVFIHLIAKKE